MKTMTMMKMMLVLVLSGVFCVSADVPYEGIEIVGCSDFDGEFLYGVDGEALSGAAGEGLWYQLHNQGKKGRIQRSCMIPPETQSDAIYILTEHQICENNLKSNQEAYKDLPLERDPPSSHTIFPKHYVELGQKNWLICHVTGFYPVPVTFSWTKNQEKVTKGSRRSLPFPNKDGTFKEFSTLEFTPKLGDIYSCRVGHLALDRPLVKFYDVQVSPDVQVSQPSVGPVIFCGVGLTVGLLGAAAGIFFLIKGNKCS